MKSCHFYLFTQSFQGIAALPLSLSSGPVCLLPEALPALVKDLPPNLPHTGDTLLKHKGYVASLINNVQQDRFQAAPLPLPAHCPHALRPRVLLASMLPVLSLPLPCANHCPFSVGHPVLALSLEPLLTPVAV